CQGGSDKAAISVLYHKIQYVATILTVFLQVRNDQVVPVYVVNLLISDVIQLCCMAVWMTKHREPFEYGIVNFMYSFGLFSSVCFMVCIAFQRYLVIACPLWYRFRRNLKTSLVVCVLVWALNFVFGFTFHYFNSRIIAFFFFFPLPLFIFFLGGTLKSLSASLVPSDEKRRIVGILVLVLLIYTLMFLPIIILFTFQINIFRLSSVLLKLKGRK
uniref:G-protein coupled receptors family 1 profile domain-containing protein n=1 Tax=Mola mola TaxID=94237 RepID=A0A3Q4AXU2_MOLML